MEYSIQPCQNSKQSEKLSGLRTLDKLVPTYVLLGQYSSFADNACHEQTEEEALVSAHHWNPYLHWVLGFAGGGFRTEVQSPQNFAFGPVLAIALSLLLKTQPCPSRWRTFAILHLSKFAIFHLHTRKNMDETG
jgi:hypothetical protein